MGSTKPTMANSNMLSDLEKKLWSNLHNIDDFNQLCTFYEIKKAILPLHHHT